MESNFAYIITIVSFLTAVLCHTLGKSKSTSIVAPSAISAVITGVAAFSLYAFIGRSSEAVSYLGLVVYAVFIGFVLALIIGYFIKILPRLF